MISRLVSHKGLDLVKAVIEDVLQDDVQFVLLGTGDAIYENYFKDLGRRYTGKAVSVIAFNGDLFSEDLFGRGYFPDAFQERTLRIVPDDRFEIRDGASRERNGRIVRQHQAVRLRRKRIHICRLQSV